MRLITVYNLKAFMEKVDSQHDRMLEIIIEGVSDVIQNHLNRYLTKAEYTHYFEADGVRNKFYLPAYPIDLTEDFTVTVNDEEQTINDDYFVRENDGLITFYSPPLYTEPKGVQVVWTGGYELIDDSSDESGTLDVPDTIRLATYMQCSYMYKRRNDIGLFYFTLPNGRLRKDPKPRKLLPEVTAMLLNYRRTAEAY